MTELSIFMSVLANAGISFRVYRPSWDYDFSVHVYGEEGVMHPAAWFEGSEQRLIYLP